MIYQNLKNAVGSIVTAKLRSFLTILGIVIGVSSVVMVIAIGEGVKKSVATQVTSLGTNVVQINSGDSSNEDAEGGSGLNLAGSIGVSTLTESDVTRLRGISGVSAVAPYTIVTGLPAFGGTKASKSSFIIATTPDYARVIKTDLSAGRFLVDGEKNSVVIGQPSAEQLYGTSDALGRELTIRNQTYKVVGILKKQEGGAQLGPSLDSITYIPYENAKEIGNNSVNIYEIDLKIQDGRNVKAVVDDIKQTLQDQHGGEKDFIVLTQADSLKIFDTIFSLLTTFVVAIASISLVVGGIGIMNIMLVSVSERTREIGIRKAIGATFGNIMGQFLIESIILSCLGGAVGLGVAWVGSLIIKHFAGIEPVFGIATIALALGVSTGVGVIFGVAPAVKAARKRPIQALKAV